MFAIRTLLLALLTTLPLLAAASPCGDWFFQLQQAYQRAGIHDAQALTVPDVPHLGINRWLVFLRQQAHTPAQQQQWLRLAAAKAWQDQQLMLKRLPVSQRPATSVSAEQLLQRCIPALTARTDFSALPDIAVADNYATWQRVLGVYPLTAWLATGSINRYHRDMLARFTEPAKTPARLYLPVVNRSAVPTPASLSDNPLHVPLPDRQQLQALLGHYAPALAVADNQPWNQPGQIRLDASGPQVSGGPAAYYWPSWTRYQGHNLLQLNYEFWFSQRPAAGALDIYAGKLDGLIWRVTLKPDGGVLFYDSIHPCGCYHKVYPVDPTLRQAHIKGDRPVFYPHKVADANQQRVMVLLQPDVHYVVRVAPLTPGVPAQSYALAPATQLRALSKPDGSVTSLFNRHGRVPASHRGERFALWPLGIPSAGTMRQPGTHAIAFKGKRHFDDPQLPATLFR
ncbi:MAG: hypothetical protein R3292_06320 [Alcanivorax sp.]|nr:hypothetical protein [Alcanivorax sp.]